MSSATPANSLLSPRITPLGLDGMIVSFAEKLGEEANRAALAFRARVEAEGWEGLRETASALTSAYVAFDPALLPHDALRARLESLLAAEDWAAAPQPHDRRRWTVPAHFGGDHAEVLAEAASLAGVTPDEAVAELTARPLRALALGYAPGQPYLGTLPEHWNIPRQTGLTPTVPEGAVVVAVRQLIVFATSGTTGWRQIGQSRFRCFRPEDTAAPITLRPGDEIRFRAVSGGELDDLAGADAAGNGGATCKALP